MLLFLLQWPDIHIIIKKVKIKKKYKKVSRYIFCSDPSNSHERRVTLLIKVAFVAKFMKSIDNKNGYPNKVSVIDNSLSLEFEEYLDICKLFGGYSIKVRYPFR